MIQKLFVDTSIRALYGVFTVWKMLRRSGVRPARLFTIKIVREGQKECLKAI